MCNLFIKSIIKLIKGTPRKLFLGDTLFYLKVFKIIPKLIKLEMQNLSVLLRIPLEILSTKIPAQRGFAVFNIWPQWPPSRKRKKWEKCSKYKILSVPIKRQSLTNFNLIAVSIVHVPFTWWKECCMMYLSVAFRMSQKYFMNISSEKKAWMKKKITKIIFAYKLLIWQRREVEKIKFDDFKVASWPVLLVYLFFYEFFKSSLIWKQSIVFSFWRLPENHFIKRCLKSFKWSKQIQDEDRESVWIIYRHEEVSSQIGMFRHRIVYHKYFYSTQDQT